MKNNADILIGNNTNNTAETTVFNKKAMTKIMADALKCAEYRLDRLSRISKVKKRITRYSPVEEKVAWDSLLENQKIQAIKHFADEADLDLNSVENEQSAYIEIFT